MDDEADPALQFFPEGEVDLYGALGIEKHADEDAIKKAYRKAALKYHPDKQAVSIDDESSKSAAAAKFQQIGFAYAVLSTPSRRARYDTTGRTDESMFDEAMDWNAYFRELWTGEVNADTLEQYRTKYQRSHDERTDILEAYRATKGHLIHMVDHVPYMSLRNDRSRVEAVVEEAIKAGEIKLLKQWDTTRKDTSGLRAAEKKEKAEEQEAMDMAREMGVYDALFGDEAAKAKSRANGQTKATKRKQQGSDEEDLSALQNLIAKRNQKRGGQMDNLIAKLEAEAAAKKSSAKGGSKAGKKSSAERQAESTEMPSEDAFARTQARLDAKRKKRAKAT